VAWRVGVGWGATATAQRASGISVNCGGTIALKILGISLSGGGK